MLHQSQSLLARSGPRQKKKSVLKTFHSRNQESPPVHSWRGCFYSSARIPIITFGFVLTIGFLSGIHTYGMRRNDTRDHTKDFKPLHMIVSGIIPAQSIREATLTGRG
jgi:hypothetical protein